jgi:hypothetical protein
MKIAVTAFALVLASGVAAYAQGSNMPPGKSASPAASDQCWDAASNTIKNSQGKTTSQGEASPGATTNPTATAPVNPANSMAKAPDAKGSTASTTRPANMPAC